MNILEFRIFILLCLLAMAGISLLVFFVREKPIRKMMDLSFTYLLLITFIVYILVIKNFEAILFPIFIIIFINFLLTLTTGISIVNNLLVNNKVKENIDIDNDDWGYNYETLDDEEDDMEKQLTKYSKINNNEDEKNIKKEIIEQQKNKDNQEYNENNEDNKDSEDNEDDDDYNYKIFKDDNESINKNIEDNNNLQDNDEDSEEDSDEDSEEDSDEDSEEDSEENNDEESDEDINIEDIKIEDLKKAFKNSNKEKVEIEEENNNFNFEEMVKNLDVHNEKNEEFNKNIDNDTEQKLKKIRKVADMIKDQKLNNKGGEDESN